ncbi:hypothetical protein PPERSA_09092 [Pseudocohnilembus persalinus]|uniref:Quinoprotein amine dehydrogenase, beta chain-like protein n=1 Tax=Pseudocohnilembus persalinus TaxID=266149 RepID=A0A0V0Q7C3_PSEPJ|nr:hypothetical protein PPERSA_09092 [Pseudocohnilembus persalinus]|eukprot:KRW98152.1 hypothetical protein PPERSA_09092 [Pseudocohnilembus persalinus]
MKLKISLLTIFLLIAFLLNQTLCNANHNINDVKKWKKTNITDEDNFDVSFLHYIQEYSNSISIQLTDSKIVVVIYGFDNYPTDVDTFNMQIAIFDNDGNILKSKTYENKPDIQFVDLSLTNVEGEFVFMYTDDGTTYMTFYDQNLEVKRGLSEEGHIYPQISLGNDLLYVVIFSFYESLHNIVIVLDLSDISTYSKLKTYTYSDYTIFFGRAYSIQAFSDDTAILYFQGINNEDQTKLVQVMYNSKGEEKSGYPKEIETFMDLDQQEFYQTWRSYLLEDKKTATFLAGDNKNSLSINTYSKDGDEVCSKIIDITGYDAEYFSYGIIGNAGWAYLKDTDNYEGHFILFNPKKCSMDMKTISDGTDIIIGIAGSLLDYENKKIYMFEFGNWYDFSVQKCVQAQLYQIGSVQFYDKDSAFVLEFKAVLVFLIVGMTLI